MKTTMVTESDQQIKPRVGEWFAGRTILVTGGTGFMGKVLLEKLLRSCPDLERILVLIRPKHGSDPSARIQQMVQLPLFERLRNENPNIFEKLVAIEGDVTKEDFGFSDADRNLIKSEVSVVFHFAALLNMLSGLKMAVESNTVSTKRFMKFAEEMEKLDVFLYVSTLFCHCDQKVVEEKAYPSHPSPNEIINLMSWMKDRDIEAITPSLLGDHPNTYTYSKQLAESLVYESGNKIHAVICRPSIVLPTWRDPIPGWVDSLNGPVGLLVAGGKGVMRSMMAGLEYNAEAIPVDLATNALIVIAWTEGIKKSTNVPVYNLTQGNVVPATYGTMLSKGTEAALKYPFEGAAWYPGGSPKTNWLYHTICVFFLHYMMAYLIDFVMLITRQKTFMVRIQKRLSAGLDVLQYFSMRQWIFRNDRIFNVADTLCEEDQEIFYLRVEKYFDMDQYSKDVILGARQYCMKEPLSSLPKARRHMNRLYYLDRATKVLFGAFVTWLLYGVLSWVMSYTTTMKNHQTITT